jgi:hypothetical protein
VLIRVGVAPRRLASVVVRQSAASAVAVTLAAAGSGGANEAGTPPPQAPQQKLLGGCHLVGLGLPELVVVAQQVQQAMQQQHPALVEQVVAAGV